MMVAFSPIFTARVEEVVILNNRSERKKDGPGIRWGAVTTSWVEDLVFSEYCNCSPPGDY